MFEFLVGLTLFAQAGCMTEDAALRMNLALEEGNNRKIEEIANTGECGIIGRPVPVRVEEVVEDGGSRITMRGSVLLPNAPEEFYIFITPEGARQVGKENGLLVPEEEALLLEGARD